MTDIIGTPLKKKKESLITNYSMYTYMYIPFFIIYILNQNETKKLLLSLLLFK